MIAEARRPRRHGLLGAWLALTAWQALGTAGHAQLVTASPTLKNASTGQPLGGSVAVTGVMAAGDPDTEPLSSLLPLIRFELDYLLVGLSEPRSSLQAQGDATSLHGTLPLGRLRWSGAGIDANGSSWTATGSIANPSRQPIGTTPTLFGTSPMLRRVFHFDQRFELANSWLTPYGTYATTLTYTVNEGLGMVAARDLALAIEVPARLRLHVPTTAFALTADPSEPAPVTTAVTATLKSNARPGELTRLKLRATPLASGSAAIPFSAFRYHLGTAAGRPLADSDQVVAAQSGASAGTDHTLSFGVVPSWGHVPGRYTSTVTYTAEHGAGAAAPASLDATTIAVEVPPRLFIGLSHGAVTLTADPGDTGAGNIARGAAAVTVRSNYGQARVYAAAAAPASELGTLPATALTYQLSTATPPSGGQDVSADVTPHRGAGTWSSFSPAGEAIATLTGRTDGAVLTYDYRAERSWLYPGTQYTTTVTYTVVGL